jgi:hypothetical protein
MRERRQHTPGQVLNNHAVRNNQQMALKLTEQNQIQTLKQAKENMPIGNTVDYG